MFSRLLFGAAFALSACAQNAGAQLEVANLREDVRGLVQRVGDLSLRVEQLELENSALRRKSKEGVRAYATLAQLNEAVADLNRIVKSSRNSVNKPMRHSNLWRNLRGGDRSRCRPRLLTRR